MDDSKVTVTVSKTVSVIQIIAGVILLFIFGLCTIMYLEDAKFAEEVGISFLVVCLVFDALGILLIILSRRTSKLLKLFPAYAAAVTNDPNGFIPNVAASLGASEDVVKKNMEQMIRRKYFSDAFLDNSANCIVIKKKAPKPYAAATYKKADVPELVTVKCKGCGGVNRLVKGQVGECDYCGSPIRGE